MASLTLSENQRCAIGAAVVAFGHGLDELRNAGIHGDLVEEMEMLVERLVRVEASAEDREADPA